MILDKEDRFLLVDEDGNVVIVTEIETNHLLTMNACMPVRGKLIRLDYEDLNVDSIEDVEVQLSFYIEGIENITKE